MKCFVYLVNPLFSPRFTLHLHALFCEGANYSKAQTQLARLLQVILRIKQT